MRDRLQILFHKILTPVVRIFIAIGLSPNALTTIGLTLNIAAAIIFIIGGEKGERLDLSYIGWGGAMIIFAGVFDMIDGQVARLGKMTRDHQWEEAIRAARHADALRSGCRDGEGDLAHALERQDGRHPDPHCEGRRSLREQRLRRRLHEGESERQRGHQCIPEQGSREPPRRRDPRR